MATDKLNLVEMIEGDRYRVDSSLLSSYETYRYRHREYIIGDLLGVSGDPRGGGCGYHRRGTLEVPTMMVKQRIIFRIVQRDSYTKDGNIVEAVRDPELVRRILDRVIQREGYETI